MKKQFLITRYEGKTMPRVLPSNTAVVDNYENALGIVNGMLVPEGMRPIMAGREEPLKIALTKETIEIVIINRKLD